jgi:hypothetical protein
MVAERWRRVLSRVASAARRYDASALAVLGRMLALREAYGLGLEEAYFAGVLDPKFPRERLADFVGRGEFLRTLRPFNAGAKELVDDKAIFAAHAESHGLPVARTLALVTPPFAVDGGGFPLRAGLEWLRWYEALPSAFVAKPVHGMGGRGVDFYERRGDEVLLGDRRFGPDDLRRWLCVDATYGRAIVQERVKNHAALAELSGTDALQCTRIVTVVARSNAIELLFAFQKLIVGEHQIDNLVGNWSGNIVASIDIGTGLIRSAFADGAPCLAHPDTGKTLAGFRLPHWQEACDLVETAARRFRPLRAVGWDVALTQDGPVLIEGNSEWFAFGEGGFWYSTSDLARLKRLL